jgi:hypothetical protein
LTRRREFVVRLAETSKYAPASFEGSLAVDLLLDAPSFQKMTPNETIYLINQTPELLKAWRELTDSQKRAVIKECERAEESDVERIIEEVALGQRRLF